MAENYKELLEKDFARQIKYLNIDQYHNLGYKGKGFTILNAEGVGEHRGMTSQVIRDFAPDCTLLESHISARVSGNKIMYLNVTINKEILSLEDAIKKYNIKILTRSYASPMSKTLSDYYKKLQQKYGVIFLCSAGNEEGDIGAWSRYDTAITVSACTLKDNGQIEISYAQSPGEVDFTMFMARGKGTSAASPAMASFIALLLQRYGDFNQVECVEILKSISKKLPNIADVKQGHGLPILPLTNNLPKL